MAAAAEAVRTENWQSRPFFDFVIGTYESKMTANDSTTLIKDLKHGQKNINLVFIVLDIGKTEKNKLFQTANKNM